MYYLCVFFCCYVYDDHFNVPVYDAFRFVRMSQMCVLSSCCLVLCRSLCFVCSVLFIVCVVFVSSVFATCYLTSFDYSVLFPWSRDVCVFMFVVFTVLCLLVVRSCVFVFVVLLVCCCFFTH